MSRKRRSPPRAAHPEPSPSRAEPAPVAAVPAERASADRRLVAGALGLALAAFWVVLPAEFVLMDDTQHIATNPHFQRGELLAFLAFWKAPYFGLYVPVSYTVWSFAALVSRALTSELHPAVFHALNLGTHLLNMVLVYRLLRRAGGASMSAGAAAFGMALFGSHPTQVESVAWASEFRGLIGGTLSLAALLVALSARDAAGRLRPRGALLATSLFALALLAKPSAASLPLALIALDGWVLRTDLRRAWPLPLAWLALSVCAVVATRNLQASGVELGYVPSLLERVLVALDALGFYAWKLVVPIGLGVDYGRTPDAVLASHLYVYTALVPLVVGGLVIAFGKGRPWLVCAAVLVLAPLMPVLGLVPFAFQFYSTVADRYLYLAHLGIALAGAHAFAALAADAKRRQLAPLAAAALLAVLAGVSHLQARTWHSTTTLFQQALAVNPDSFAAHHGLATHHYWSNRYAAALHHCRQALAIKSDYLPAHKCVGDMLLALGDREGAIRTYRESLRLHGDARDARMNTVADTHAVLGAALANEGQGDAAIDHLRKALAMRPSLSEARRNLGLLHLHRGETAAAIEQFRLALAIDPRDEASRRELDRALAMSASAHSGR